MHSQNYGYHAKKGKFGYVKKTAMKFDKKLLLINKYGNKKALLHSGDNPSSYEVEEEHEKDDDK